jgi:hypothetical protein
VSDVDVDVDVDVSGLDTVEVSSVAQAQKIKRKVMKTLFIIKL